MNKKILRITTEINRSSIGRTAEQIGKLILKEGWDSIIAFGRTDGTSESKKIKIGSKMSLYWHVLITRLFDLHGYGSHFATKKLVKNIDNIKPDIIHLHNVHGYYINLKVLFNYLSSSKTPIVWTQHDCWSFTGHCAYYTKVNCEKWKETCFTCPLTQNYPSSWILDRSYNNYLLKKKLFTSLENVYLVAVSHWMSDQLERSFLNKYPIDIIYNGIDTNIFKPIPNEADNTRTKYSFGDKIILLAVATDWSERKGLSDYYKLRKILKDIYTIVLVGLPIYLSSRLPEGIVGIKRIDDVYELVKLYSTASIVLNLSYEESFGKTTPEGMACGVPSIVYNSTASPELLDNKTGIIVEKGDVEGVANAINTIMNWDKEETINNCVNRVYHLFDMNKNLNKYIILYKKILKII